MPLALLLRLRLGGVGAQRAAAAVAPRDDVRGCWCCCWPKNECWLVPPRGLLQSTRLLLLLLPMLPRLKVLGLVEALGLSCGGW